VSFKKSMKQMNITKLAGIIPLKLRNKLGIRYFRSVNWWKYDDADFPYSVTIETATHCNRACYYCPNSVNTIPRAEMPWELFRAVIKRLKDIEWAGVVSYHFLNEPLLDKRLEECIAYTKFVLPKSMPRVYSNGDAITADRMRSLIKAGMTQIVITQHPPATGGWIANINRLQEEFPGCISYRGALQKQSLVNWGGKVTQHNVANNYKKCPSLSTALVVTFNGDVLLCCQSPNRQPVMGNLKTQGVMEIWNNETFKRLRSDAFGGNPKLSLCRSCLGLPL
jgi:radical SAM protein with 4Fe4S-binding SPASM domain